MYVSNGNFACLKEQIMHRSRTQVDNQKYTFYQSCSMKSGINSIENSVDQEAS